MRNNDYISYFEQNIEINKLDTISNELSLPKTNEIETLKKTYI